MLFRIIIIVWLSGLTTALLVNKYIMEFYDKRITNIEYSGGKVEHWVCSHTTRQRVLITMDISGAYQAYMDVCDEWKPK